MVTDPFRHPPAPPAAAAFAALEGSGRSTALTHRHVQAPRPLCSLDAPHLRPAERLVGRWLP